MKAMIEDYLNGMHQPQIREKYGMTILEVSRVLKPYVKEKLKRDVERRALELDAKKDAMIADYRSGLTQDALSKKYKVGVTTVADILRPYQLRGVSHTKGIGRGALCGK